jgi:hypothetical protein
MKEYGYQGDKILGIDELRIIRAKIKERNLSWSAGSTSISDLPLEEQIKRLGLVVTEEEKKMMAAKIADEDVLAAQNGVVFVSPAQWDWRNVSRNNWTTSVKDQSGCGSCVAFATVGTIEANLKVARKDPLRNIDLSEADLFFRGCGNCCGTGWNFVPALRYAQSSGIPDEACFPYDGDEDGPCGDRDKRAIKIDSWRAIYNISQAKEWISTKGPIIAGMEVCSDFFCYFGGIYTPSYGDVVGNHAICIVGYNDAEKYWICKNSWGTTWGEDGWFRIAYGECGIGSSFAFYTAEFTSSSNDLIMPINGRVLVRFKSRGSAFDDDISLYYPSSKLIFKASNANIGQVYDAGTFTAGTKIGFSLLAHDGYTYYTDSSKNRDACDHVRKTQLGTYKWELRWEDVYGLVEQDFNDVVMEVEITNKTSDDIVMPKAGKLVATFKRKNTNQTNQFMLANSNTPIFATINSNVGKTFSIGTFSAGTKLGFSLKAQDGNIYYTDSALNKDASTHVKVVLVGTNKWELRWSDRYGVPDTNYNNVIVGLQIVTSVTNDIIMPTNGRVVARFLRKGTPLDNEFRLYRPVDQSIFLATSGNLGKTFDVGQFPAGTQLTFGLRTTQNNINYNYYTDISLNQDSKSHVQKLQLRPNKWQLRWEDRYNLTEKDYGDLIVEISVISATSDQSTSEAADSSCASIDDNSFLADSESEEPSPSTSMSSSVTGDTTDTYVAVLSWNCLGYSKKTLVLACTHGSNDLKYRIRGYAKSGSSFYDEIWAETTLVHGNSQPLVLENIYNVIALEVKSALPGRASSFILDYCGGT